MIKKIILIFITSIFFLFPIGFFIYLLSSSNPQLVISSPENNTIISISENFTTDNTHKYKIIRIPPTFGVKPGESGSTPEDPYGMTPPLKLSHIPYVKGTMYNDKLSIILQDIIDTNKGRDIVISYGDTYCGACIRVMQIFGDFKASYGNIVKFISIMENDPDRIRILIDKYFLNPDIIFVSDTKNLSVYHKEVLQGYMYNPIVIHINTEGVVDRVNIGSFNSIEMLKNFMGVDIQ